MNGKLRTAADAMWRGSVRAALHYSKAAAMFALSLDAVTTGP